MITSQTDILVVGAGLAGTLFALELAKKRPDLQILLLSKKEKKQSASFLAQGGIAAVLPGTADSQEQHLADTLEASSYSCDKAVAAHFIGNAAEAIRTLEYWGTAFDTAPDGNRALALEGGHSTHRVLHHKDSTGKHILETLHVALALFPNIRVRENVQILKLKQAFLGGTVKGAWGWDEDAREAVSIDAKTLILATGGLGSLYAFSTNPATAKGEGIYLAAQAGAAVKDLAFVQFHPTALYQTSGNQLPLISEAVRGAGAKLRNEAGKRFMYHQHPRKELAPRDIIARTIHHEIRQQLNPFVFLDGTGLGWKEWNTHFPGIFTLCKEVGLNPLREWIPVVPAAHYSCGGVVTSVKGETTVDQLFVIGETACTGLHGANRLASNSLLEASLMATSLATHLAEQQFSSIEQDWLPEFEIAHDEKSVATAEYFQNKIRDIVQNGCGIVKTSRQLKDTYQQLMELKLRAGTCFPGYSLQYFQLKMWLSTAIMLTKSCMEKQENKGVFFNSDLEKETENIEVEV